jgi:hypothetical protein
MWDAVCDKQLMLTDVWGGIFYDAQCVEFSIGVAASKVQVALCP